MKKLPRIESTTAKRKNVRRALSKNLNLESLETRALMANDFLAGTAFIDANSNGQLDTTESYLAGATIELRSSVGTLLQTATTDAKGAYQFNGLSPGNYKLVNLSAGGYAPTSTQSLSRLSPVTASTSNTIDVTLTDPASLQASIDITAFASSGLFRNMSYNMAGTTVSGSGGQLPLKLHSSTFTPNPTASFLTLCVDLYNDLGLGVNGPFAVTPNSLPIGNGSPHNAERIAYLYNHYGQSPQGSNGAAALQIATWELLYDAGSGDLDGDLTSGNFRINSVSPSTASAAVLAQANLLLAESVGKAESAIFLNVPLPAPSTPGTLTNRQGVIVTGAFNFGNQPEAKIGDYVWLDGNANGQQDLGESGIDGLPVNLLNATGTTVLAMTLTGDNPNVGGIQHGYYEFKGLAPGSYVVQFFTGAGYSEFTTLDVGADTSDSDANPLTGKTAIYTLTSGQFNQTADAGLKPIDLSLSKTVSNAAPAVGDNVTFTLTVNNANGFSTATHVNVTDVLPPGMSFVSATASQGTFAGNIWTIGTVLGGQTVTLAITAKVDTGGKKTNYAEVSSADQFDLDSTPGNSSTNEDDDDQVSLTPTAAIGDYVWLDLNANGQQDSGEPGLDNLMVQLLNSTGTTVLATTYTGDDPNLTGTQQGYYEFKGLTPGSYIVQFYTGGGYDTFTAKDSGADASDSDADILTGKTIVYTLASGDFNQTVDAGLKPIDLSLSKSVSNATPAVGDNVTFTVSVSNANGFSTATGVEVKDVLPPGLNFVSGIPSVGTYSNGTWSIGSVNAGQTVTLVVTATVVTGGTKTNYAEVTAANQLDTDSTPNNHSTTEDDNGSASLTPTAAIGDYVWLDLNSNGQQDLGEEGIDGVTVNLLDSTGSNVLYTTTTSDNPHLGGTQHGYYEFKGLAPGSYVVQFLKTGLYDTFTSIDTGLDATDSDANPTTGKTAAYALASGDFNQTVDAGFKPIDLSLTKSVLSPTPAVGDNVTFTISVTNANGFSTASGVKVNDVLPAGLTFVSAVPSQGTYAGNAWTIGTIAGGDTVTLLVTATVTSGGTKTNYAEVTAADQVDADSTPNNTSNNEDDDDQASLTPTAAIGDYVWLDLNADGQQGVDEPGLDGLTVNLLNPANGSVLFTTTTGDNPNLSGTQQGYYQFVGLAPGNYVVQFSTGAGYSAFTSVGQGDDTLDSDADPITGKTTAYTLVSGEFNQTVDAGLKPIDLSLTKSVNNSTPTVGSTVTYTLTVNNANGFSNATGVEVKDVLPSGMTLVSASPSQGTYAASVWTVGSIAAGQGATLTITATVNNGGTKTNYAEITAAGQYDIDSAPNNNSTDEDDDDQVSLTPSASIGDYVWVDVNNNGIQDEAASYGVNGVTVTLYTSGGVQVTSTVTGPDGSNNPGYYLFTDIDPGSYYVVFTANAGQVFTTTGLVAGSGTDSNANSAGQTANFTLDSGVNDLTIDAGLRPIDLSLTKNVSNTTPAIGSNIVYTLTANNANGFSNATGVTVKDVLPAGLTLVSATATQGTYASNIWTIGNLNANQSVTLTITATVTSGSAITNFAQVQSAVEVDKDSTPGNNTDGTPHEDDESSVTINPAGIVIKKYVNEVISVGGEGLSPGFWKQSQHFYAWTAPYSPLATPPVGYVSNYNAVFGLTAIQSDSTLTLLGALQRGGGGANALGRQAVAALLNASNPNVSYLYSASQIISMVQNAYATNSFDSARNLLEPQNNLGADLTSGGSTNAQGPMIDADSSPGLVVLTSSQVAFTFIVSNPGAASLSNVVVTDNNQTPSNVSDDFSPLPVLVTFSSQQYNVGDLDHDNLLDPSEQWQYKYGPIAVTEGLHTNIATVVGTPVGGSGQVTSTNPANWEGVSENLIDLSVTKTVNNAAPQIGSNVNFTITVANAPGLATATGVHVQDLLPAGLTFVSYTATVGTTYNYASGDWNVGTLASGGSAVLTVTATVATSGSKTNYAEVSAAGQLDIDSIPNNTSNNEDDDDQVAVVPAIPLVAKIDIEKTTNGPSNSNSVVPDYDNEDSPTGAGVPVLTAGTGITWTYKVTNTGNVAFATSDIVIVDDNGTPGVTTDDMKISNGKIAFVSVLNGNADNVLDPNEVWLYRAISTAQTVIVPGVAPSTTIDFQGSSALDDTDGNVRTFTSGGISVKTSAFSRSDAGVWSQAYLGSYGGGLGVTDVLDGTGANDTHTVDNMGGSDNYVLFEFSQSVILDAAALGYVVGDSDMTVWIGSKVDPFNNHTTILSDAYLSSLGFTEVNLGANATRLADLNSTNYAGNVLVIAAKVDESDDRFKIQNVVLKSTAPAIYENSAVVTVPGATDFDLSHYKNPSNPGIDIEKTTNGPTNSNPVAPDYHNEDAANGTGVPVLSPDSAVTWTYKVTNTGNVTFTTNDIAIEDDNGTPTVTMDNLSIANGKITFSSILVGDTDNLLEPGEAWLYQAVSIVQPALIPGTAAPTTIDFSGNTALDGTEGNVLTFSSGSVSVKASAFSRSNSSGAWSPAYLGSYGGGLGVTDGPDGTGANDTHTVDNLGGTNNYVLFEFSQSVIVDSALLGYVVGDSDMSVWIGYKTDPFNNHLTLSDSMLSSLGFTEVNLGSSAARTADINAANLAGNVLIVSSKVGEADDRFKIQNVMLKSTVAGIYENKAVITVPGATDFDLSHYANPESTICTDITTTGNSSTTGTAGNVLTFGNGNISVRASAFSRTDAAPNTWNTAFLGSFAGGLGVTDGSETGAGDTHTLDNAGGRDNYIVFEFSQSVLVDKAFLGYVSGDSDITVWVGTKNDPFTNHISLLSDALLTSMTFTEDNDTTLTSTRTADINAKGIVGNILIIAASTSDTTPDDFFKVGSLKVCTPAKTKFFVVNDSTTSGVADRTYEYATGGTADENYTLNSGNTAPRGAAATATGDKVWVVDANSKVYVYNNSGGLLGSWTATLPTGAKPEGISVSGADVWIVTSDGSATGRNTATEKVFRFSGSTSGNGASRISGSQTPISSFYLNAANLNPKDLVTDGTSIWVVNDASSGDRVFKYDLAGNHISNWVIDAANTSPTGITLDPSNVSNLWIVDSGTKRIYQYNGASNLATSSTARPASTSFALSANNTNPQGIADPPVWNESVIAVSDDVQLNVGSGSSPLFNSVSPTDVNGDGVTSPLDALLVVNELNGGFVAGKVYHDVNDDGVTSPIDALLVVNYLNSIRSNSSSSLGVANAATEQVFAELGEGESTAALDDLFADVAAEWGKTNGLQGRRLAVRAK